MGQSLSNLTIHSSSNVQNEIVEDELLTGQAPVSSSSTFLSGQEAANPEPVVSTEGNPVLGEIEVSRISHRESISQSSVESGKDSTKFELSATEYRPSAFPSPKTWLLCFSVDVILEFRNGTRAILSRNQELRLYEMSIVRIDISDTQITEIPHVVFDIDSLEILVLSRNLIREIPDDIHRLQRLRKLVCDNNRLENISGRIGALSRLEFLDFTHNRIRELPNEICQLASLLCLGISDCELESFPDNIGNLYKLQKLGAFNNQLRSLPPSMGKLHCLQKLDLSRNHLVSLPSEIGNLVSLTWFNLSHNKLIDLPATINELHELKEIGLGHNNLTSLPDLSNLKKLCILPVYCNNLKGIGDWVVDMQSLTKVDFSCNSLENIPAALFSLKSLTYLNLKKNQLRNLSCQFLKRPFLTDRENTFQSGATLSSLAVLDLSGNQLTSVPYEIKNVQLKSFRYSSNLWNSSPLFESQSHQETIVPTLKQLVANCILDQLYHLAWAQDFKKARHIFEIFLYSKLDRLPLLLQQFCIDYKVCSFCHHPYTGRAVSLIEKHEGLDVPFKRQFCTWLCMQTCASGKSPRSCRYLANLQITSTASLPPQRLKGISGASAQWITPNSNSHQGVQNFSMPANALDTI